MAAIVKGRGAVRLARSYILTSPWAATLLGSLGGGGGGGLAPEYDTRFGVTDPATGWTTFPLRAGCRRIWVDLINGNDANDGLTAATALKTFAAGFLKWIGSGKLPGDQLMLAGGVVAPTMYGPVYTDPGNIGNIVNSGGYSNLYLAAVLSYDRNDPTNEAKYGKLVGSDMPIITWPASGTPALTTNSNGGDYYAFSGFEVQAADLLAGSSWGFIRQHDGWCFQNLRFNGVGLSLDSSDGGLGAFKNIRVTRCALWGRPQAMYDHYTTGLTVEDCIYFHAGWSMMTNRNEPGGPSVFIQGHYHSATSVGATIRRNIYAKTAACGFNMRGDVQAECIVSIDEPLAAQIGGFSAASSERPDGIVSTVSGYTVIGGDKINDLLPRGWLLSYSNTLPGTKVERIAAFDNPTYGLTNNKYFTDATQYSGQLADAYMEISNLKGYGYSPILEAYNTNPDNLTVEHTTYTNCETDVLAPGSGNTLSSAATFTSIKTRADLYAALGFAADAQLGLAQLGDMLCWRPDLAGDAARAIDYLCQTSCGNQPTYGLAYSAVPNFSGITPPEITSKDFTKPVLTSPVGTATGPHTANIGASTTKGFGKIWWVATTSGTKPTGNQIKQGQDNSGAAAKASGTLSVSESGAQTGTVAGLDGLTSYYIHYFHDDEKTNWSDVVSSAQFTTAAPTLGDLTLSSTDFIRGITASGTITGTNAGSTVTATGLPAGLTIDGTAQTWAWDGTGTGASSGTITLTETLPGATNSPHTSPAISYTIEAAFTPASISNLSFWHEAADLSTLYTDAGVTNATNGQAVYRIADKSGNGYHFDQAVDATTNPTLSNPGGATKPYVSFSGTKVLQTTTAGTGMYGTNGTMWFAVAFTPQTTNGRPALAFSSSAQLVASLNTANPSFSASSYSTAGAILNDTEGSLVNGTPVVLIAQVAMTDASNGTLQLYANGSSSGPIAITSARRIVSSFVALMGNVAAIGAQRMTGKWYGDASGTGVLTADEISKLTAYFTAKFS